MQAMRHPARSLLCIPQKHNNLSPMSWRLFHMPRYTGKDGTVLLSSMFPLMVMLNVFLYGKRYWAEPALLLSASAVTFAVLAGTYLFFTRIGILLTERFPGSDNMLRRMT
ncbi:MAG: hypothetical protein EOO39_17420, partial [Cytophagaceae bacterium]